MIVPVNAVNNQQLHVILVKNNRLDHFLLIFVVVTAQSWDITSNCMFYNVPL